jgi:hypothetical protein
VDPGNYMYVLIMLMGGRFQITFNFISFVVKLEYEVFKFLYIELVEWLLYYYY